MSRPEVEDACRCILTCKILARPIHATFPAKAQNPGLACGKFVGPLTSCATPVFVDILPDTLNIDPSAVAAAITSQTRAIVPVHCGGNACDTDVLKELVDRYGLVIVEDAAHAVLVRHGARALTIGALSALRSHERFSAVWEDDRGGWRIARA